MRHGFADERAVITTALLTPLTGKALYIFACERKDLKQHF